MNRSRFGSPRASLTAAALAVISACSGADAVPATHIEDLPTLTLEETLRIGSVDDPDVGFTNIGDVWVSPAGEVYLSEVSDREIRVYGTDGRLLRTYGREGVGPGEFRSVGWFGVVGDTLWVSDGELHRTTLFSLDGQLQGTVTALLEVPIGEQFGRPLTVSVFPNALRPDGLIESMFVRAVRANLPNSVVDVPRVLFDRTGKVVDTLEMVRTVVSRPAKEVRFENRTSYVYLEPPEPDSGSYEAELVSGKFVVHWSVTSDPPSGSLSAIRSRPDDDSESTTTLLYTPRPVTDQYRDSVAASRVRGRLSRSDSLTLFEAYRSAMQHPPHHIPVWPPLAVGEGDGTVWTKLDPDDPSANRWLVFRENAEVLGTLSLPMGALPRWSRGDDVWIVERDAFDVPWLVQYRIVAPGG